MKIVWRKLARADRANIFEYIAKANPRAALALDAEFDAKAEIAARHPDMYKARRVHGTREIVVRPNYVMIYQAGKPPTGGVVILRVLHAKQQWPPAGAAS